MSLDEVIDYAPRGVEAVEALKREIRHKATP